MKISIKRSKRYEGFGIRIDEKEETFTVEDPAGKPVIRLVMEDFLDRLGTTAHGFKRKYPRLAMGVHVKYLDHEGHVSDAVASVIGAGGLFIDKFNPLPKGTDTHLEFSLPASQKIIAAQAKVVWNRKNFVEKYLYPGMGIKFTEISEEDRTEIMDFVNRFNRERGIPEY
jgi:uncharacterized protein (TIGR02266 family)